MYQALRQHLIALLRGGQAFVPLEHALDGLPFALLNQRPGPLPHSVWELTEHLRIAQQDIIEFSLNPTYVSPAWPEGYWPDQPCAGPSEWRRTCDLVLEERDRMIKLAEGPDTDLFTPFAHGNGQTLLREIMLVAEHHAYHTGQIILVRRAMGAW
ncbi:MAG: DinB family protein [Catalinimonas sp.]